MGGYGHGEILEELEAVSEGGVAVLEIAAGLFGYPGGEGCSAG